MTTNEAPVLTVREVAGAFGVSPQRVRKMISDGVLPARRSSAGWLVPADVVAHRRERYRGRPVASSTAWAVIAVLTAGTADVLTDRRLRYRVRALIAALPDPTKDPVEWRLLLARRGQEQRVWAHPGVLKKLAADRRVSRADAAAVEHAAGLSPGRGQLRLYVGERDADRLVADYQLRDDPEGGVVLVVVPDNVPVEMAPMPGEPVPPPAVVADLLDENDPRAQHAAARQLRSMRRAVVQGRR